MQYLYSPYSMHKYSKKIKVLITIKNTYSSVTAGIKFFKYHILSDILSMFLYLLVFRNIHEITSSKS